MVVLQPGEIATHPEQQRYLKAVATLEEVGRYETARSGYLAAFQHWPDVDSVLIGLGDCCYRLGRIDKAENAYRSLVAQPPEQEGYNLAHTLAKQGQYEEALAVFDQGLVLVDYQEGSWKVLQETREEIITLQPQD